MIEGEVHLKTIMDSYGSYIVLSLIITFSIILERSEGIANKVLECFCKSYLGTPPTT